MKNYKLNNEIEQLKALLKLSDKELKKYKQAYLILIDYYDSIADEEKPFINKRLKGLGL